jgi:hypothetical protein
LAAWSKRTQLPSKAKQLSRLPVLQLELKLVDRSLAPTGIDLTSIECNLNIRAVPFELIYGWFDARLKHWSQSVANARAQ